MKVVWTKSAEKRLTAVLDYIEKEFGIYARLSFKSKVIDFTSLIREFSQMGTLEIPDKNLRGFQLTKQTKIFYRVKNDQIIILTLFDSRQNPRKKPR